MCHTEIMNASNSARLQRLENQLRGFVDQTLRPVAVETIIEPPASGKWSANEHLAHLARHHQIFLVRVNRILKEERPALTRYLAEEDPEWERWRRLAYKEIAEELSAGRERLVARLKALSDSDFERTGVHSKFGEMSLASWLEFFLVHEAHHLYAVMQLVLPSRS